LGEAVQQQVEVCACASTKKKNKQKTSFVELQTEASKLQLSSFMKKLWILSPVTRVRPMAVNLTWNSVDSDLPLGKTFPRLFQSCPIS
jgi:hypothetical protein